MNIEYESRILEVDIQKTIDKLKSLNASFVGEYNYTRYVYDTKPVRKNKWIRLRSDGKKTTLTFKEFKSKSIDGTNELEIEVSDLDKTKEFLKILGYTPRSIQENKRTRYNLNGVEIDIDSWPFIPSFIEVEGKNEMEVSKIINILKDCGKEVTNLDVQGIYEKYGYKKEDINYLSFKGDE